MQKYLIRESCTGGLIFYDSYERIVGGEKVVARREENTGGAEITIVFPSSNALPDDDEELNLNDYKYDIVSITGDIQVWWYIEGDLSERKEDELLEELYEGGNEEEKWSNIEGCHVAFLQGGYDIIKKL
ncbi:hypothetical protein [Halomonas sp. QHL1]|uniref:hypothetical protein n=1 Tax=Halomonas sp. QHL1 TaxID=1123773 RepID=UPI0008FD7FC4|nr:hypothetical protein [Halomonas sp. QHL1]OJA06893.1 hypothetical protein QHL1GM_16600 [Halomonas sp. QHL1]